MAKACGALPGGDAPPLHEIPKLLSKPRTHDEELDLAMQPRDLFRNDARSRVVEPDRIGNERHPRTLGSGFQPDRAACIRVVRHDRAVCRSGPGTNLACPPPLSLAGRPSPGPVYAHAVAVEPVPFMPQIVLDDAQEAERRQRFPLGEAIEFADLEEHARADALGRLRAAEPLSWVPALGGWLVTGHALGRDVLGRRKDFTVWAEPNLVRASLGVMMLTSDSGEHDRQRLPFDEPFRMRAVRERFEAPVSNRVAALVAGLVPRGECELACDFAAPFAIGVAGDILGLSLDDVPRIRGFYDAFAGAMVYDGDPEPQRRADAARAAFDDILLGELARVRRAADGSITSAVANNAELELSDDEIVAQLRVILFGAIETVESMVLNSVLMLLLHPDELATVRAQPDVLPNAIEEALRLIPPVAFIERWTSAPARLGGVELERG